MRSDHTFHIALPVEETWRRLTDLSPIADSATGGTYRGTADGHSYRASFLERDELDHRLVLTARTDPGATRATITASLHPSGAGTRVDVRLDLTGTAPPEPRISELITRLTSPPEATHAPAPGGAPHRPEPPGPAPAHPAPTVLRGAAGPACLAVIAGVVGFLLGRHTVRRGAGRIRGRP